MVFACLQKDSKDAANLPSHGKEFQSLGAATEKALSRLPTKHACEGGGTEREASLMILTSSRLIEGDVVFSMLGPVTLFLDLVFD